MHTKWNHLAGSQRSRSSRNKSRRRRLAGRPAGSSNFTNLRRPAGRPSCRIGAQGAHQAWGGGRPQVGAERLARSFGFAPNSRPGQLASWAGSRGAGEKSSRGHVCGPQSIICRTFGARKMIRIIIIIKAQIHQQLERPSRGAVRTGRRSWPSSSVVQACVRASPSAASQIEPSRAGRPARHTEPRPHLPAGLAARRVEKWSRNNALH